MGRWIPGLLLGVSFVALPAETGVAPTVPGYARTALPAPGAAGRLARLTDDAGGLWLDTGSRWVELNGEVINVKDAPFEAKGDGVSDDTSAIRRAIDVAADRHATVVMPPGTYVLTSQISISAKRNLRLVGLGGAVGETDAVVLKWNGPSHVAVLVLDRVRDSEFGYFSIVPGTRPFDVGLEIGQFKAGPWISTHNRFRAIHVSGGTTAGIRLSRNASDNNELHVFEDVTLNGSGRYGLYIGGMQSKWHRIIGGNIGEKEAGIYVQAGSFLSFGTNFSHNRKDVHLGQPVDAILIEGAQSEGASQFLTTEPHTAAWAVTVKGSRLTPGTLPGDGVYLSYFSGGPLVLLGNDFADGVTRPKWRLAAGSHSVVAIGNVFPNDTPFRIGDSNELFAIGNVWSDHNHARALPAHVASAHHLPPWATVMTGLGGRSMAHDRAKIQGGSLTIADGATSGAVRFKTEERDRSYLVSVTPTGSTGTPAAGSNRVVSVGKDTSGLTVTVEVAPGQGRSVTFDWHLSRER